RTLVIEGARQNACGRGLAHPAHAGEDPGLRHASGLEGIRERTDHRLLADQIFEGGGTVFAGENPIGRRCRPCALLGTLASIGTLGHAHPWLPVRRGRKASPIIGLVEMWEADERPEPELVRAASFRT